MANVTIANNKAQSENAKPVRTTVRGIPRTRNIFGKSDIYALLSDVEYNPHVRLALSKKALASGLEDPIAMFENTAVSYKLNITPIAVFVNDNLERKEIRISVSITQKFADELAKRRDLSAKLESKGYTTKDLKGMLVNRAEDSFKDVVREMYADDITSVVVENSRFALVKSEKDLFRLAKVTVSESKPKVESKPEPKAIEQPKDEPKGKALNFVKTEVLVALAKSKKIKSYKTKSRNELIDALKAKGITKA